MRTVGDILGRAAEVHGEGPALLAPGRPPLSWEGLRDQADRTVASLNERGIGRGDRVAIVLENGPEAASAFLSVSAGASSAPLNPRYRAPELEFFLGDLRARALLVAAGEAGPAVAVAERLSVPVLRLAVDASRPAGTFELTGAGETPANHGGRAGPDDEALVLHTSGTTSRPKIVPLGQENLAVSAGNIRSTLALGPEDRVLNVMPLFHIHGLMAAVLASASAGASVVATPGFLAPSFFDWLAEFSPTWYTAVPTMHQAILARVPEHRETIARHPLRFLRSSSASLPPAVLAALEETFGAPVVEAYGMTEAAHQMASNPLPPAARKPGSVGPGAGPEITILDTAGRVLPSGRTGEVAIRGENVFAGYEANPEANAASFCDGWFRTGDEGRLDEDGYLFLTGRLKEIINRGGEKISPREIDEVLLDHPAVAQAVAFAIPHPTLGEEIGAAVVLAPDAAVDASTLLQHAGARLADFKLPRRFVFLDEIPKGPTGKLRRIGLAEVLGVAADEPAPARAGAPLSTKTRKRLAALWRDVLRVEEVGGDDDFFARGGDSLLGVRLAVAVKDEFGVEMPPWVLVDRPDLIGMADWIDGAPAAPAAVPATAPTGDGVPLTDRERELWVRDRLAPGSPADHRPTAIRILGPTDPAALSAALAALVRRHPILGSAFPVVGGSPVRVERPLTPDLPEEDLSEETEEDRELEVARRFRGGALEPFDLETGPLLRARLLRLEPEERVLLLFIHHIVFDGWSASIAVRDLAALHAAATAGEAPDLRPIPPARADPDPARAEAGLAHFLRALEGAPRLRLPDDGTETTGTGGDGVEIPIGGEFRRRIEARAREAAASPFAVLFAGFLSMLSEVSGQDDLVVGTLVHGRSDPGDHDRIGLLMRLLPVRTRLKGARGPADVLDRTWTALRGALAHPEVSTEALVRALRRPVEPGRHPIIDVVFQSRTLPASRAERGGVVFEELRIPDGIARADLLVEVREDGEGLVARFAVPSSGSAGRRVNDWARRWIAHLEEIVATGAAGEGRA